MALTLNGTNKIVAENLNTEVKTLFTPKNWIINGGFDVWQRGTSQTSGGYGSDDRWTNQNGGSTKTHSQQMFSAGQTDVPNNPTYFSRTIVSSIAGSSNFVIKEQRIEDVSKLSGKTVSLSFWAKADSSKNLSIQFAQNFGSGGSSSVEPLGVQKFSLTTSWQRFTKTFTLPSISGKTIGSGSYIQFRFFFDAGSVYNTYTDSLGQQSGTFDIANVSLVEGSVPVEWQTEAYADVLRQCQRYLEPITFFSGWSISTTYVIGGIGFAVQKRAIPVITLNTLATPNLVDAGINVKQITSIQSYSSGLNGAEIDLNTVSLTANKGYFNYSNILFWASAEL